MGEKAMTNKYAQILIFYVFVMVFIPPVKSFAWESYIAETLVLYVQKIDEANLVYAAKKQNSKDIPLIIRFYGIGIPTTKQPFGFEAHNFLINLLPKNSKIIVTIVGKDDEGILNALVQYKDHSVNNGLVDQGLAWVERATCKAFFCRRWYIQEHIALKDKRGIWSLNSTRTPWQWGTE
jgi:Micrococcal nuclease (thermonuclease) homologs